ncbi:hypothetical protein [Corallococcus sicarius]|uniref:Uncharacterized protein n=1 Tax=Corallococcus sicarius TaxID=2316726 RepID=A0A3A8NER0_9BACT|nr:hypothetical protein [Corallococcus sicarius]RKH38432.1 hypothetical protein D7X12_26400 [Corallococcus sicarius]
MSASILGPKPFNAIQKPTVSRPQGPVCLPPPPPVAAARTQGAGFFSDGFTAARSAGRNPVLDPFSSPVFVQNNPPPPPAAPANPLSVSAGLEGALTVSPNGVSVEASGELEVELEGGPFSLTVGAYSEVEASQSTDGDMTTFSVEAEVSVKAEAGVETPLVSASVTGETGARGSYQVSLPREAAAGITTPEQAAALLSPFQPGNLPVGTTIEMHGETFMETGMSVTFQNIANAFDLTVSDSVERARGMSIAINKVDENTVRVTIGPTETVSRTGGLGIKAAGVEVSLSTTGTVDQQSARQVDFDISTPEGQAAYDRFLATGQLPGNDAANGTSNAATVDVISGQVTQELTVAVSFGESTPVTDDYTYTTYDDGRQLFEYSGRIGPVTLAIAGEVNDPSTHTYDATATGVEPNVLDGLRQVYPGMEGTGDSVTLSFTNAEGQRLMELAQQWVQNPVEHVEGFPETPPDWVLAVAGAATPEEAIALMMSPTANYDSTAVLYRMSELSLYINPGNDPQGPQLPGTATAQ